MAVALAVSEYSERQFTNLLICLQDTHGIGGGGPVVWPSVRNCLTWKYPEWMRVHSVADLESLFDQVIEVTRIKMT